MFLNSRDLIWQFWPRSSGDLLTLTGGRQTSPCNISSQNLTSPVGLSNQSVPGRTGREISAHTKSFSLDFALPRGFLLQPPESSWSPRSLCWFDTWEWRTPSSFFPDPGGATLIPKTLGWVGQVLNQDPTDFQRLEPPCSMGLLPLSAPARGHLRRKTETGLQINLLSTGGKNETILPLWSRQLWRNWNQNSTSGLLWENGCAEEGALILYPTPNSDTETGKAAWDSPFITRVAHGWPKKEISQNNNSAVLGGFWVFTLLPWERTRLSLNSSLAVV